MLMTLVLASIVTFGFLRNFIIPTDFQEQAYAKDIALTLSALSITRGNIIAYYDISESDYLIDITENIIVVTGDKGRVIKELNLFHPISIEPTNIRGTNRFTYQIINNRVSFNNVEDFIEADVCLAKPADLSSIIFKLISSPELEQLEQDIITLSNNIDSVIISDTNYLFEVELLKEEVDKITITYPVVRDDMYDKVACFLAINSKNKDVIVTYEDQNNIKISFPENKLTVQNFDLINNLLLNSIRGNIIR